MKKILLISLLTIFSINIWAASSRRETQERPILLAIEASINASEAVETADDYVGANQLFQKAVSLSNPFISRPAVASALPSAERALTDARARIDRRRARFDAAAARAAATATMPEGLPQADLDDDEYADARAHQALRTAATAIQSVARGHVTRKAAAQQRQEEADRIAKEEAAQAETERLVMEAAAHGTGLRRRGGAQGQTPLPQETGSDAAAAHRAREDAKIRLRAQQDMQRAMHGY